MYASFLVEAQTLKAKNKASMQEPFPLHSYMRADVGARVLTCVFACMILCAYVCVCLCVWEGDTGCDLDPHLFLGCLVVIFEHRRNRSSSVVSCRGGMMWSACDGTPRSVLYKLYCCLVQGRYDVISLRWYALQRIEQSPVQVLWYALQRIEQSAIQVLWYSSQCLAVPRSASQSF